MTSKTTKKKSLFNLLFVCTGNTCRSPMAEGILKKLLSERKIRNFQVSSAGIQGLEKAPAAELAIQTVKNYDIDLTSHISRKLIPEILLQADLILVMSPEHHKYIQSLDSDSLKKTFMLKAFPEHKVSDELTVKDPILGGPKEYLNCFFDLEEQVHRILPVLLKFARNKNSK